MRSAGMSRMEYHKRLRFLRSQRPACSARVFVNPPAALTPAVSHGPAKSRRLWKEARGHPPQFPHGQGPGVSAEGPALEPAAAPWPNRSSSPPPMKLASSRPNAFVP